MPSLSKILWVREERPDLYTAAAKYISIKEYVLHRLFGQYVVDHSIASATGRFNLERLDWDEGALELVGVRREQLSQPVPTTHVLTGMNERLATQMWVRPDVPFAVGAFNKVLLTPASAITSPASPPMPTSRRSCSAGASSR